MASASQDGHYRSMTGRHSQGGAAQDALQELPLLAAARRKSPRKHQGDRLASMWRRSCPRLALSATPKDVAGRARGSGSRRVVTMASSACIATCAPKASIKRGGRPGLQL